MIQYNNTKLLELVSTKHSNLFQIKLNLEFQTRYIGKLDTSGQGTLLIERDKKHLFQKTNSLGINTELLTSPDIKFKYILIDYAGRKLSTTRMYFLTHSKSFKFSQFELQHFLEIDSFGLDKANEYEKSIQKQLSLFEKVA
jgi:hypothetical protein